MIYNISRLTSKLVTNNRFNCHVYNSRVNDVWCTSPRRYLWTELQTSLLRHLVTTVGGITVMILSYNRAYIYVQTCGR